MSVEPKLIFCGDTMLGATRLETSPFTNVREFIQEADIAFCNLETTIAVGATPPEKRHVIASREENIDFLADCGFDIVNLAHNHILDQGEKGSRRMLELLSSKAIHIIGLRESRHSKPVVIERKGTRFGFLGYADYGFRDTFMPLREEIALEDVGELRKKVDCVVVSLHWGYEYVEYPSPRQQAFARKLVRAGAQMVIGHHPHVVQGVERYQGGLIAYSLGNFQFKVELNDPHLNSGTGMILRVCRSSDGRLDFETIPVETRCANRVECCVGERGLREQKRIAQLSRVLNGSGVRMPFWLAEASKIWFPSQLEALRFRAGRFGHRERLRMLFWLLQPLHFTLLLYHLFNSCVAARSRTVSPDANPNP